MSGDLSLVHVGKRFGDVDVLRDVNLEVRRGETVAIVGPSGSGKSTLLNIVGSLEKPSDGSVLLGPVEVERLEGQALADYRATEVGFVFQEHHLLPQLTAVENVLLPTLAKGSKACGDRASEWLARLGVEAKADAFPAHMSGGERQRVAIARALINDPGLLLCDEPTGNLDQDTGSTIVDVLLGLASASATTVLMVTHNADHAARFARCLRLVAGRLEG